MGILCVTGLAECLAHGKHTIHVAASAKIMQLDWSGPQPRSQSRLCSFSHLSQARIPQKWP